MSFGKPGAEHDLRGEEARQEYLAAAEEQKVELASLAMGILNEVPYATARKPSNGLQMASR